MKTDLKIAELSNKLTDLVSQTKNILETTNNEDLKSDLLKSLDDLESRTDLKISFVGQYSSGKSTIISALTGDKNIKIDANVATDTVTEYVWNNITLLDTPGILAGKVEQHDFRTKEALKNSDLVLYVLTSQLFDDVIFENFIDLAYNQHFKDKMMIVVNKMSLEAGGFENLKENYLVSLKNIFKERNYDFDFNVVFIDAADYIDGVEDNDEEFIKLSNFDKFINSLNFFVNQKGIIKKQFDTPVRLLKSSIADISLTSVDPNLSKTLNQYTNRIKVSRRDLEFQVKTLIYDFESKWVSQGAILADNIGIDDEQTLKSKFKNFENNLDLAVTELIILIEEKAIFEQENLLNEIGNVNNKDSIISFNKNISLKLESNRLSENEKSSLLKQKLFLDSLSKGSNFIMKSSLNQAGQSVSGFAKISSASGSQIHNVVKQTGAFFGHKFKPWEAVKITGKIGNVAKFAGPLLSFISVGVEARSAYKEEKQLKNIQIEKNKVIESMRKSIQEITNELNKEFKKYLKNSFDFKLNEIENKKIEIANEEHAQSDFSNRINKLDSEFIEFIEIVDKL